MISYAKSMSRQVVMLKMFLATLLLLMWAASCTSSPSETPEKFVLVI